MEVALGDTGWCWPRQGRELGSVLEGFSSLRDSVITELGDFLLGKQWQGQEVKKDIAGALLKLTHTGDRRRLLREVWRGRELEGILCYVVTRWRGLVLVPVGQVVTWLCI